MREFLAGVRVGDHLVMIISLFLLHLFIVYFNILEIGYQLLDISLTAIKRIPPYHLG